MGCGIPQPLMDFGELDSTAFGSEAQARRELIEVRLEESSSKSVEPYSGNIIGRTRPIFTRGAFSLFVGSKNAPLVLISMEQP